jgi:tRNA 5-methylaminomethyl-2-thiouridine biosynthesis bifunctional protein
VKTSPIAAAQVSLVDGVPFASAFGDVYHSRAGALAQAEHVFLRGNGLPQRWCRRERFVVLETGFGLGNNFLATWEAWRADPQRSARLEFISIEKHPLTQADLRGVHVASPLPALAEALAARWPPLTHNLHAIDFDDGRVRLLLAFGDVQAWLPELLAAVDAFYLDGFAPGKNPAMWDSRVFKALGRLAAPEATAATWSVAREVRDGLRSAGFAVEQAPGFAGKRSMTVARYAPAFRPTRPPARVAAPVPAGERRALVVGAGLAGAWAAHALAAEGWACTLFDRQPSPAQETSGNPAGLFHGVVTPEDGAHARFYRACALHAARHLPRWLESGVPGAIGGLLRLSGDELHRMQAIIERQGLPADYVQALDTGGAARLAGCPVTQAAWHYPGGGWLAPAALVRALTSAHGCRVNTAVASLRRGDRGWQLLDAQGGLLDESPVVVLANAADASRLLGQPDWSLFLSRGQVTWLRDAGPTPRLPIAGAGYVVPLGDGQLLCGATNDPGDHDMAARAADDERNLAQLGAMLGRPFDPAAIEGRRVGWRLSPHDRLPVIGAVPADPVGPARLDQPRFVPRQDGLYVLTALGSRGITTAPLLARTLAAWIAGAPVPLEASLLDAIDVARFTSRAARRGTAGDGC